MALFVLSIGCEPRAEPREDTTTAAPLVVTAPEPLVIDAAAHAEAGRLASELEPRLMDRLVEALRSGEAAALAYCIDSANAITERMSAEGGRVVRRVTDRVRNPTNAPDSVEALLLERFAVKHNNGLLASDTVFMAIESDGRRMLHFARPILVREGCLACHGDPAGYSPTIRQLLARNYPNDAARNYAVGELRGMVSVRIEVP
jgi:hypothetical protein